jgi:hypothetical protein
LRPGSDAVFAGLAAGRGMKPDGELPLMVLDVTAGVGAIRRARGLTIRQIEPREGPVHANVAAAAMTTRAVADAVLAGAAWCWLQSSEDGYPVYRGLGFRTIETWSHWMSGP